MLIMDINDNTPFFPPNGYSVKISEGAKANSDVIAAVAIDPDAGSNSELTYELISGNTGGEFHVTNLSFVVNILSSVVKDFCSFSKLTIVYPFVGDFSLDPNTAMIRTRKNLERQQTFSYTLTIGVSDHGKPTRIATVTRDYF